MARSVLFRIGRAGRDYFLKKDFFDYMVSVMRDNPSVYLIFAGLGYPRLEEFLEEFPDRAINTEASEQTALDICVGLSYSSKIPFVYTISPFLLRGFETIRTYINHENLQVILIGAGRDDDYSKDDGFSHDATDIGRILDTQDNIRQWYPNDTKELHQAIDEALVLNQPHFISLRR